MCVHLIFNSKPILICKIFITYTKKNFAFHFDSNHTFRVNAISINLHFGQFSKLKTKCNHLYYLCDYKTKFTILLVLLFKFNIDNFFN